MTTDTDKEHDLARERAVVLSLSRAALDAFERGEADEIYGVVDDGFGLMHEAGEGFVLCAHYRELGDDGWVAYAAVIETDEESHEFEHFIGNEDVSHLRRSDGQDMLFVDLPEDLSWRAARVRGDVANLRSFGHSTRL